MKNSHLLVWGLACALPQSISASVSFGPLRGKRENKLDDADLPIVMIRTLLDEEKTNELAEKELIEYSAALQGYDIRVGLDKDWDAKTAIHYYTFGDVIRVPLDDEAKAALLAEYHEIRAGPSGYDNTNKEHLADDIKEAPLDLYHTKTDPSGGFDIKAASDDDTKAAPSYEHSAKAALVEEHTTNGRILLQEDGEDFCGSIKGTCTNGAHCISNPNMGGNDWCLCNEAIGYFNGTDFTDVDNVVKYGLHGYLSCLPGDECTNQFNSTNVCALDEDGGACEDRSPENGGYMCSCQSTYIADESSIGPHGPTACTNNNECVEFDGICGENKDCVDTDGSFECTCKDGFSATQNGDCIETQQLGNLTWCISPTQSDNGNNCTEPERECDEALQRCVCIPGYFQPAGVGSQCVPLDHCALEMDVLCDRRGRDGPDPRSKCINQDPFYGGDGIARLGYRCECLLPGFQDSPNSIEGTNCSEVEAPAAETAAPVASAPVAASTMLAPAPTPPLPCTTFNCPVGQTCIAALNACRCNSNLGFVKIADNPLVCAAPSGDLPVKIPPNDMITDTVVVPSSTCTITDINVFVDIKHMVIGRLVISLEHASTGTSVVLWDQICGFNDDLAVTFDDASPSDVVCPYPSTKLTKGTFLPASPLHTFNGESLDGPWTLKVIDSSGRKSSTLNGWNFNVECGSDPCLPDSGASLCAGSESGRDCRAIDGVPICGCFADIDCNQGDATDQTCDDSTSSCVDPCTDNGATPCASSTLGDVCTNVNSVAVCGCENLANCNVGGIFTGQTCSVGGTCEGGTCLEAVDLAVAGTTVASAEIDFFQVQTVTFDCVPEALSDGVTITVFMAGDLNSGSEFLTVSAGPKGGTLMELGRTQLETSIFFNSCTGVLAAGTESFYVSASDFNSWRTLSNAAFSIGFSLVPSASVENCQTALVATSADNLASVSITYK